MPFGILSAPEVYQKSIDKFFGVSCYLDNLCVWSNSLEQHFERLEEVFKRTREYGLKFNSGKYEFIKEEIDYLGHVFTENSIKVDQKKISAIKNMLIPNSKQELMRFLGMVTYLMKFIPDMSSKTAPLREFLENDTGWQWMPKHEEVVQDLKKSADFMSHITLFFKVTKPVTIQCDASKDGLGAVLLQGNQPVTCASRSLSAAEQRYAQIKKETLAIVFSLESFHQYVYGRKTYVSTDHKPIVAIMRIQ
ncbi:hypothetical protein RRG08_031374 [Elysia crispata]|uniref:Reverse transcriptase domain-containing protein n=1 Tax=Elysia crispata TaxID=231223 RepID=A0AAE1DJR1_9GAST|nr:hypothetical protein RRG08_031374 [Elysia crispata]